MTTTRKAPEGAKPAKPDPELFRVWVHFNGIISITNGPGPGLAHAWPIPDIAATREAINDALHDVGRGVAVFHRGDWLAVDVVLGYGNSSDFDQFKSYEAFRRRLWTALAKRLAGNYDD